MKRKKALRIFGGVAVALAAAALVDALVLEHLFFKIKHFKIGNTQTGRDRIKMIHLTDLHLKKFLTWKHSRLAKAINRIKPDMLLITGDTIDERGNTKPLRNFLPLLDRDIRIIAIPGNHEHKAAAGLDEIRSIYRQYNGDLLVNQTEVVEIRGHSLVVTGMDDIVEGDPDFAKAMAGVKGHEHYLALIHSPKHQESIIKQMRDLNKDLPASEQFKISYFFAGHNHGGQVTVGDYVPVLPEGSGDYVEGWFNKSKPYLYLSKGFGTSSVPFRFMARAEITVFDYYL